MCADDTSARETLHSSLLMTVLTIYRRFVTSYGGARILVVAVADDQVSQQQKPIWVRLEKDSL